MPKKRKTALDRQLKHAKLALLKGKGTGTRLTGAKREKIRLEIRKLMAAKILAETAETAETKVKPMTNKLEAVLKGCSVRELIVAMRNMRTGKDTLGFDYSKIQKAELLERARKMARELQSIGQDDTVLAKVTRELGWSAADVSAKISAVAAGGSGKDAGKAKRISSEGTPGDYGRVSGYHGPDQGGASQEPSDGPEREKTKETIERAAKEAAEQAAKEAVKAEIPKAKEQLAEELMENLSKSVFKIEVTSDEDGDGESESEQSEGDQEQDQSGEGEEGEGKQAEGKDGKQKKSKKTRTVESSSPRHVVFQEVCAAVSKGLNVLLVGPAGCGKTHMAMEIAQVLGLSFRFTGAVSSEYKLLGFMTAHGTLVETEYRKAYEQGGVFLWDELDASSAQAMLSFNAGLANGHQDFPDKVIPMHPKFRAIASANTYGNGADRMYVGRNQLDAASLDRFYVIDMDYDEQLERLLYGSGEWVKYVQGARRAMRKLGGIRHVISMRAIQMGLKMKDSGIPRDPIERACLWRHMQKDDINKIKKAMERTDWATAAE